MINTQHSALWDRLRAFDPDDPASPLSFTRRLARENRWTDDYTRGVVDEYKRFAFLAVVAGHPVTPSDAVDQAWHLHLVYTRSYWDDFCGEVLKQPLHHGPTRGGSAESAKYHDWYAKTLESYRRVFGQEPPADIWPAPDVRFGKDLRFVRVNLGTHWVIPRPDLRRAAEAFAAWRSPTLSRTRFPRRAVGSIAALVGLALLIGGCVAPGGPGLMGGGGLAGMTWREFLKFYIPLALISIVLASFVRGRLRHQYEYEGEDWLDEAPPITAGKLDRYEAALLAHGPKRGVLVHVALVNLVGSGAVQIVGRGSAQATSHPLRSPGGLDPIEEIVVREARPEPGPFHRIIRAVRDSTAAEQVEGRLIKEGLVIPRGSNLAIRSLPALLLAAVILLGAWRIPLGMSRGRPVGILVATCGVLAAVSVAHLIIRPWRTRRGDELVRKLRRDVLPANATTDPAEAAMAFAVLGVAALPPSEAYQPLRTAFTPPAGGSDGSTGCGSSGSGCGGAGGGCGGGGCGGCGS